MLGCLLDNRMDGFCEISIMHIRALKGDIIVGRLNRRRIQ